MWLTVYAGMAIGVYVYLFYNKNCEDKKLLFRGVSKLDIITQANPEGDRRMTQFNVTMVPDETYRGWELCINGDEYNLHFESENEAINFLQQLCDEANDCLLSICTERHNLGDGNMLQRCFPLGSLKKEFSFA